MKIKVWLIFVFLFTFNVHFSQEITGLIFDAKTNEPIEGASIYFDNTTIGTTSDVNGNFSILYQEDVKSPLVVSFLGYKKQVLQDFLNSTYLEINLIENTNALDEVFLTSKDSWSRKRKLEQFRMQFLGFSKNSRSCKILNEDDIILRYLEDKQMLVASIKKPLLIRNKELGYIINYDLQDFEIQYATSQGSLRVTAASSVFYAGTTFYKSESNKKKILKQRLKTYNGSVLHFMRSLLINKLEENKFSLLYENKVVPPVNFISVYATESSELFKVRIFRPLTVVYNKNVGRQSTIKTKDTYFYLDRNGNHSPVDGLIFTGEFGNQRIGDTLPLDYSSEL
jgi:hypothetical protein